MHLKNDLRGYENSRDKGIESRADTSLKERHKNLTN